MVPLLNKVKLPLNNVLILPIDQIYIPCHYQSYEEHTKNFILFFHGNAEDIGLASAFTKRLAIALKVQQQDF